MGRKRISAGRYLRVYPLDPPLAPVLSPDFISVRCVVCIYGRGTAYGVRTYGRTVVLSNGSVAPLYGPDCWLCHATCSGPLVMSRHTSASFVFVSSMH